MKGAGGVNRFDALRLGFAGAVAIYHLVFLAALDSSGEIVGLLSRGAEIAVQGFFVISGALVYRSLTRSKNIRIYAEKRARRILPAYAVMILVPGLAALGAAIAGGGAGRGAFAEIGRYFLANAAFLNFLEPNLPGLFADNPMTEVNGALWTIKIEVAFYALLPLLAWVLAKSGRWRWAVLGFAYVAGEAWRAAFEWYAASAHAPFFARLSYQLPGQVAFFAAGIALALLWDRARSKAALFALAGAPLFVLSLWPPLEGLRGAGLMGLIAGAAFAPGPALNAARWGDLSYGVYISHFPIIQTIVAFGFFAASPFAASAAALLAIIAASLAMWRFVEAPFLLRDSHYQMKKRARPPG
jgi:peptidoglycan/LPS O-acetylase OafA/YrhL